VLTPTIAESVFGGDLYTGRKLGHRCTADPLKDVLRLDPAVDIWCPFMGIVANSPEVMAALRKTGKPIVPYRCAENKHFWPAQDYRLWSWQLYQQRAHGMFI
jgi:hypothetical protein